MENNKGKQLLQATLLSFEKSFTNKLYYTKNLILTFKISELKSEN